MIVMPFLSMVFMKTRRGRWWRRAGRAADGGTYLPDSFDGDSNLGAVHNPVLK